MSDPRSKDRIASTGTRVFGVEKRRRDTAFFDKKAEHRIRCHSTVTRLQNDFCYPVPWQPDRSAPSIDCTGQNTIAFAVRVNHAATNSLDAFNGNAVQR